jgi:hypothetical protein
MAINFGSLLTEHKQSEHRREYRVVPVAVLRRAFPGVDLRDWQSWRERCGVPKHAHYASRLSALKLWILASANGQIDNSALTAAVSHWLTQEPDRIERWLNAFTTPVGANTISPRGEVHAAQAVMDAINKMAPDVAVTNRARLYEWFDRAGMRFSTRESYTYQQLTKVIAEARRSQRRGRWGSTSRQRTA